MTDKTPLKVRLGAGVPLFGFFVGIPSPAMIEMIAHGGFDFVIIDREHGPLGLDAMEHMIRAAEAAGIATIIRVPANTAEDIMYAVEAGADAIMVPHVTDAEVARQVVRHACFPPLGRRGMNFLSRAAAYGSGDTRAFVAKERERLTVLAMIEDAEALPHAGAIAGVEGIDGIFIGPNDLAASLGHPGDVRHPDVVAAIAGIKAEVRRAGGMPLATTTSGRALSDAGQIAADGFAMVCFSAVGVMMTALRDLKATLPPR